MPPVSCPISLLSTTTSLLAGRSIISFHPSLSIYPGDIVTVIGTALIAGSCRRDVSTLAITQLESMWNILCHRPTSSLSKIVFYDLGFIHTF